MRAPQEEAMVPPRLWQPARSAYLDRRATAGRAGRAGKAGRNKRMKRKKRPIHKFVHLFITHMGLSFIHSSHCSIHSFITYMVASIPFGQSWERNIVPGIHIH